MEFLLLIVTLVFIFYLLYVVFSAKKEPQEAAPPDERQTGAARAGIKGAVSHAEAPAQARSISRPERAVAADNDSEGAAPAEGPKVERLRDPETGEIAASPTNYRFAKRWIKEALVREGLLDRIYKPNEIDEAIGRKVRDALARLKVMDKYQA